MKTGAVCCCFDDFAWTISRHMCWHTVQHQKQLSLLSFFVISGVFLHCFLGRVSVQSCVGLFKPTGPTAKKILAILGNTNQYFDFLRMVQQHHCCVEDSTIRLEIYLEKPRNNLNVRVEVRGRCVSASRIYPRSHGRWVEWERET